MFPMMRNGGNGRFQATREDTLFWLYPAAVNNRMVASRFIRSAQFEKESGESAAEDRERAGARVPFEWQCSVLMARDWLFLNSGEHMIEGFDYRFGLIDRDHVRAVIGHEVRAVAR